MSKRPLPKIKCTQPITPDIEDEGGLLCPICPPRIGSHLTYGEVRIYDRDRDDDDKALVTRCRNGEVNIGRQIKAPPDRTNPWRAGIRIAFNCDQCETRGLELTIQQHEGATFVAWAPRPIRIED